MVHRDEFVIKIIIVDCHGKNNRFVDIYTYVTVLSDEKVI